MYSARLPNDVSSTPMRRGRCFFLRASPRRTARSWIPATWSQLRESWRATAEKLASFSQSMSWDQVAGIQDRAVRRGLSRRKKERPRRIGIDETSFRKRAEYITVVNDLDRNRVLWIGDERRKQTLSAFYAELGPRG